MKNEEITNCSPKIEFLSQIPFLLRAKFPFSVSMALKLDRYKAGIIPDSKEIAITIIAEYK